MRGNDKRRNWILPLTILNCGLMLAVILLLGAGMRKLQKEMQAFQVVAESKISALEAGVQTLSQSLEEEKLKVEALESSEAARKAQVEAEQAEIEAAIPTLEEMEPGTVVDMTQIGEETESYFQSYEIFEGDAIYQQINGKSYRQNNHVGLDDLRYLKVLHYNFDHEVQVGEIIVNVAVTEDVLNIFRELFDAEYEIQSMFLIDNYWAGDGDSTDTASIEVNNTSGFNYRQITGGGSLSRHAYGCAIDINPQQNPYVWYSGGEKRWSHSNASAFIDRSSGDPHMIVKGDICYSIFEKYGFSWGGNWSNPIDYQHFEKRL